MYWRTSAAARRIIERHAIGRGVADAIGLLRDNRPSQLVVGFFDELDGGTPRVGQIVEQLHGLADASTQVGRRADRGAATGGAGGGGAGKDIEQ